MDPSRDSLMIENTPIDSLDFASPVVGLGSKMGLDITKKWDAELALSPNVEYSLTDSEQIEGCLAEITKACPEIIDIHLQNNNASMVVVSINKQAVGNGKKIMEAVWSQFDENKFVIVCDDDVDVSDWNDIIWAVTTRMDPARDTLFLQDGDGHSKMGLDATNKLGSECLREWGTPIKKDPEVVAKIDAIWDELGIL
jgi:4-hydroxy-3-polyprenylbenzoate decarboxylase